MSTQSIWYRNYMLLYVRHVNLITAVWHYLTYLDKSSNKLSPERQSAWMSEIKNGELDQYGPDHFEM